MKYGRLKPTTFSVLAILFALPVAAAAAGVEMEISLADAPFTLERAVKTALQNSRTLKQSFIDYDTAGKKVDETRAQFGFNLKLTGNAQRVEDSTSISMPVYMPMDIQSYFATGTIDAISPNGHDIINDYGGLYVASPEPTMYEFAFNKKWQRGADMQLTKPLFMFGKKRDAVFASKKQREQKGLDVGRARLDLVASVKESFYNFLLMKEVLKVQKEAVKQAEAHLDAAKKRFEVGVTPKFDVIRAEVEVAGARESLTTAKKGLDLVRMAFNNLLGLPVDKNTDISDESAYELLNLNPLDYYVKLAMENRPEVKQLAAGKELVLAGARLSRLRPSVGMTGMWTFYNRGSGFGSEHTWRLIMGAEVPLFDNGLSNAQQAQARRTYDRLELTEIDLSEGITLQVKQAYLSVNEARERLNSSKAVLEMAQEAFRMAGVGFREGVTTSIELLDAEHGLTQARLNRAKAGFDYETEKARLAKACGLERLPSLEEELGITSVK